jgi:hypothetical protein
MNRVILYHSSVQGENREVLDYYGSISERLADTFSTKLTEAFEHARRVRAERAKLAEFDRILKRVPDVPPDPGDELPDDYQRRTNH